MACHSRGESGGTLPSEAPMSSKLHSPDSVSEWRSREQLEPSPPSTSPAYWDTDEDDDSNSSCVTGKHGESTLGKALVPAVITKYKGPKPTDLYGKFTWKIENFSEISKRELRSNVFEVGGYKWYILVYPQGCDVCNHLSLFLCVADYDKLLPGNRYSPGWSHFAQFTIAVVNKDPKKSKYSDTLHRFCKKEHDWGWKKFMELSKVLDGFTVADTLVIKAQVQVIRENPHRPFRCLDCQYRRELVRVYLTNVEGICRRFVEEKREKLGKLMEDVPRWTSFRAFWSAVEDGTRRRLAREKTDVILKAVVKRFFNEKEVTSTLVMDALYSGCKALDYRSRNKKGKINGVDVEEAINPVVWVDKDAFVLAGDVLLLLERVVSETLPPYKDDKGPQNRTKDGSSGEDFGKDSVERDERRLTELGRRTVEMFVLAHLYTNRVEVAYREAVALKRQEELIREEEAAGQAETELRAKREAAEKEKRSKKKQAKQRRKDRKDKDKEAEEKRVRSEQESRQRQSELLRSKERLLKERKILLLTPADTGEEEDELSGLDTVDDVVVGTLGPAIEDGDIDRTSWEREGSYGHSAMEAAGFSGALLEEGSTRNGRGGRKHQSSALDDSSSTCSSDSLPSVRPSMNGSFGLRPSLADQNHAVLSRGRNRGDSEAYDNDGRFMEAEGIMRAGMDPSGPGEASSSCSSAGVDSETVILSLKERVRWLEQRLFEKDEEVVLLQEQVSLFQHQMGLDHSSPQQRLLEEAAGASRPSLPGTTSSLHADESRSEVSTSSVLSDGTDITDAEKATGYHTRSSKGMSIMNGHMSASNGHAAPAGAMFLSHAGSSGESCSNSYSVSTAKLDVNVTKSPTSARNRNSEASRPPRVGIPPFSSGFSSVPSTPSGIEETSSSSYSATLAAASTGLTRPTSAPGLVATQRPGIPVPVLHPQPPLSRSMSAAGRFGVGLESTGGAHSNGNIHHSPPVTPSYRNAAAGKMRGSLGLATYTSIPTSSSVLGGVSGSMPGATTSAAYLSSASIPHQPAPSASASTSTVPVSSPPLMAPPKMRLPAQVSHTGKLEATTVTTLTTAAAIVPPGGAESLTHSLSLQETSGSGQTTSAGGRRSPVGITFGTVTPEMLHQQQQQEQEQLQQLQQKEEHSQSQPMMPTLQKEPVEQAKQEPQVLHENLARIHPHVQHAHQRHGHQNSSGENGGLSGVRHAPTMVSLMESVNNGGPMGEEFPHLDIINDLLEDDQGSFGMALSAMLQHPGGAPGFNSRHLSGSGHSGMHKLNQYGQLRTDGGNAVNGVDGSDRGRAPDDDRSHLHGAEGNANNMRDNRRMTATFQHQPLGRLHSQHSGHLDGVSSHYWPLATSTGLPAGNNGNNVRNGMDGHMGYPLVPSHHVPVPDCSGFSLGHNGYSVYAPVQQP